MTSLADRIRDGDPAALDEVKGGDITMALVDRVRTLTDERDAWRLAAEAELRARGEVEARAERAEADADDYCKMVHAMLDDSEPAVAPRWRTRFTERQTAHAAAVRGTP